jgi:hypothetical protein
MVATTQGKPKPAATQQQLPSEHSDSPHIHGYIERIRFWDQGAGNLGVNARALPKHTSGLDAQVCGVGGPNSDASTGRANAL